MLVLAHDLVTDRKPTCSPKLWDPISRHKTRIRAEFVKAKLRAPVKELMTAKKYARVNTLLISRDDCIKRLIELGFTFDESGKFEKDQSFSLDEHIQNLLVFPPGTDLTKNDLYRNGLFIIQDKASCMPVAVLQPPKGSCVVDACAAPGNKTTQLAAAVGPEGTVIAFERDPKRVKILESTLRKHQCHHVLANHADFLTIDPLKYENVEYALVDPSCSGSGMLEEYEKTDALRIDDPSRISRLQSLSNFQCMILRHAMKCRLLD